VSRSAGGRAISLPVQPSPTPGTPAPR
jgi:hypothetical protein